MRGPHVVSEAVRTSGRLVRGVTVLSLPFVSLSIEALSGDLELHSSRGGGTGGHAVERRREGGGVTRRGGKKRRIEERSGVM
jgi:hypothetical protein